MRHPLLYLYVAQSLLLTACARHSPLTAEQVDEAVSYAQNVDPDELIAEVTRLVAAHASEPGAPPDSWDPPHRTRAASAFVFERFTDLGYTPTYQESDAEHLPVRNVWASIPGSTSPKEVVLVTAHHDVWFTAADDNSSGVVALLTVARALQGAQPGRTIHLVSTDQEETTDYDGMRLHYETAGNVVAHINLDTIAYADRSPNSQRAPLGFAVPSTADFIAVIGNDAGSDLVWWATQLAPKLPHPVRTAGLQGIGDNLGSLLSDLHRSDHAVAWERGIPAVMFTDTTEYRNPHYHQETDTVDTLDAEFFAGSTELAIALVWASANQP